MEGFSPECAWVTHGGDHELEERIPKVLNDIQAALYNRALQNRTAHTKTCLSMQDVSDLINSTGGFAKTMWCGDPDCETKMKDELGVTSRCILLEQENISDVCVCCGKPAKELIYWGVVY